MPAFDLAAKLTVRGAEAAVAKFKKVRKEAGMMQTQMRKAARASVHAKTAMMGLSMVGTGAAVALGLMARKAVKFEAQMGTVSALVGGKATPAFGELEGLAKRLGASTVFSATEAAQGIEVMTRAGFKSQEVMGGLEGIMSAAAAEGLGLAEATQVVSGVIRAFGRDAKETTDVADALAFASAKTNTNIAEIGEAFRYAGGQAHTAKLSYQETAGVLGILANATLKGSVGGTSFANMLLKMGKPSRAAQKLMKKYKIELLHTTGASKGMLLPMGTIVKQMVAMGEKQPTVLKNMKVMSEMFGIRGAKAMQALIAQEKKQPGLLDKMTSGLHNVTDANRSFSFAQKMAKDRLQTFSGQMTLMKSAMEGFSIEVFGQFLKGSTGAVIGIGKFMQAVTLSMQVMKKADKIKAYKSLGLSEETIKKAKQAASGIQAAIGDIKQAFIDFKKKALDPLGIAFKKQGESSTKAFTRMAVKIVAGIAIAGPLLIGLAPVIMTLKGAVGLLGVAFKLAFSPMGKYMLVGAALIQFFGKGKTFADKFKNSLKGIASALGPLITGLGKMAKWLGPGGTLAAIAGIGVAGRLGKAGLKGLAGKFAGKAGPLGSLLGQAGGIAGMPVMVTNWPLSMGGTGLGGPTAGPGKKASLATKAAGAIKASPALALGVTAAAAAAVGYVALKVGENELSGRNKNRGDLERSRINAERANRKSKMDKITSLIGPGASSAGAIDLTGNAANRKQTAANQSKMAALQSQYEKVLTKGRKLAHSDIGGGVLPPQHQRKLDEIKKQMETLQLSMTAKPFVIDMPVIIDGVQVQRVIKKVTMDEASKQGGRPDRPPPSEDITP